ncbi:hypothetical protein SASPL_152824 [Salvia splendens]|uniref:ABC1 atypical kinase-like domain-containing protein n=1 Tax=Salvia splendens TaxID=180675 RepID=A0A8X8Z1M3_SALSN|nr:hypothetical protein SASPL_152824 [Salvia splendens]
MEITCCVLYYKYSLHGLPADSDEYGYTLSQIHLRSARRIQNLCDTNKGFYVKAGQFVAAARQVPREYSSTLSSLQDQISFKRLKTQRAANNFKSNKLAKFPYVYWDFACKKVLTMEFCEGHKIDDLEYLKRMGINPLEVAKTLIDVFAEMIFVHGFLHGDPHPGNILVSPDRHNGFSLVILDHGIYKQLPEEFRKSYCHLWEALIRLDSQKIQHLGETFGVGKYARYFPVIFTGRTINSVRCIQIEDEYQIHSAEGNSGYYGVHKLRG